MPHHSVSPEFPHRMNKNGTIDSICPRCFTTVGCSTWEADLDRMEAAHVCEPARLACFTEHRRIALVPERPFASSDLADLGKTAPRPVLAHSNRGSRRSA